MSKNLIVANVRTFGKKLFAFQIYSEGNVVRQSLRNVGQNWEQVIGEWARFNLSEFKMMPKDVGIRQYAKDNDINLFVWNFKVKKAVELNFDNFAKPLSEIIKNS